MLLSFVKVLGLFFILAFSLGSGILYWQSRSWKSQVLPESYQILRDLESKGLYRDPDRVFRLFDGRKLPLSSLKGKVVVFSFWATWCEPCIEEFPSFVKLLDVFPEKVVLLAVSQNEKKGEVFEFIEIFQGHRENLFVIMDGDRKISRTFGVDRLPEAFVFDTGGQLLKKIIGIQNWASPQALKFFNSL